MLNMKTFTIHCILSFLMIVASFGSDGLYEPKQFPEMIKRLKNEKEFCNRIESRISVAKEAIRIGISKAENDLNEAHLYCEAARIIAEFGIQITDAGPDFPYPGEEGVTVNMALTALAATERLRNGLEKMNSYETFFIKHTNNEYQKEIQTLENKLIAYKKNNVQPLEATIKQFEKLSPVEKSLLGTRYKTDKYSKYGYQLRVNNTGFSTSYKIDPNSNGITIKQSWEIKWRVKDGLLHIENLLHENVKFNSYSYYRIGQGVLSELGGGNSLSRNVPR